MTIAIDFGTSNTVVARWNQATQQPETIELPKIAWQMHQTAPLVPSLVYVEDASQGKVLVGQAVRDRGLDLKSDPRFFRGFKRGIGQNVQGFLPELDGEIIDFERVGSWFFSQVVASLRQIQLPVESLVLTVPVDSFESYRYWLGNVCKSLQVEQVRLLDEPTAAALGYASSDRDLLLVVDFGGGTLDLSLVQLNQSASKKFTGFILKWGEKMFGEKSAQKPKLARVIAKSGLNLGGGDIDDWLVDYFVETQGIDKTPLMTRLSERLKIQLSMQAEAEEIYFDDETLDSYELKLNRKTFEEILQQRQFFQQLDKCMEQVLQQARRQGIEAKDIEAVLMVGGTVQIPAVQNWVEQYFDRDRIRSEQPMTAIATGALQLMQGMEVKDFLYHSYGIRYWDRRQNQHNWHPIVQSGQPYPMSEPVELVLGASVSNQPSIELVLGELGTETGGMEVYFDGDRLVTRPKSNPTTAGSAPTVQPLNDREGARQIAKLDPPANPGSDRIKVRFWVDEQRFLRVTVEDLLNLETLVENQIVLQLQ
ncbi:Hsp70 family protein [Geitlerinema sp. PCC 9228]|jgi:molecular chaperone DnaK (HSP70)|uniref:Hsp70 family protein n=1 Tax=Geitlerinema sp. PCC 9228 TaxID=111611 RepID=UPI0008F9891C|nr:Hsp70 family protein [Geitlerinema sp. PCC 9228]